MIGHLTIGRRRLLTLTAAGVTATAFGGFGGTVRDIAFAGHDTVFAGNDHE